MRFLPNPENAAPISASRWLRLHLVLLGLVLLVNISFPVSTLSQKLNDLFFWMRGHLPASSQVALVTIDDATLARHGRWPWHRQELATLINTVSRARPAAIGLDVLLSEPEDEQNDAALAAALRSAGNVVLAEKISTSPGDRLWVDPLPRFLSAAKGTGHVQAIVDFDGLCRSIPIQEPSADGLRPAFALKVAELVRAELRSIEGDASTPTQGVERVVARPLLIDFRQQFEEGQSAAPFTVVSAGDLLEGKDSSQLRGKAVLIGFGGIEVSDRFMTPVSDQLPMPGVEINANIVDMLLEGRFLQRVSFPVQLILLLAACSVSLWLVVRFPGARGLLMLAALLVAGYFASYFLFLHFHRLLSFGPLLTACILAAPIAQLENILLVDREVTSRLQQLRQTIGPGMPISEELRNEAKQSRLSAGALHWKLGALGDLQAELSSLYAFRQTLLETMREGLAVYSANGKLRFSNATWNSFCERHDAEVGDLPALAAFAGNWSELLSANDAQAWSEHEVLLGEELWLFRAVPLPWTEFAEAGALLLIAEDISARRQRDQARSEALSFVTHELRTPLVSIQGFSELLMRYPNSPASREAPTTIFRETNRLVAMINTYLEVLRLDSGARPLRLAPASVKTMAQHVQKVVEPLAATAKVSVRVELKAAEEQVVCDETLIAGALLNLVSNAIKYGATGSEVLLRIEAHEHEVEFEVHNFGPAIPAEDLEQIFERFYRPARTDSIPGWGIGLSFVRRICQQHGGDVRVSSSESEGTSFTFTLPRGARAVTEVTS
jgi:signal transduction histidine kinase/CHASE2 domain-containing sensor protein